MPCDLTSFRMKNWFQRIREGDTDKFQFLAARYAPKIYGMALRLMRNPADALQQIFLQVFRKLNSFRGESAFRAWLYRVALNALYMNLRQRKAAAEESFDENLPRFDESGAMPATAYTFPCNPECAAMKAQAIRALREAIELYLPITALF